MTKYRVPREPVVQPLDKSIRLIPLTQGKVAIVDAWKYDFLVRWNWHTSGSIARNNYYATRMIVRQGKWIAIRMHRVIIEAKDGELVDHINGNTLDCREANLRKCDAIGNSQNHKVISRNRSGHSGVNWHTRDRVWTARIYANCKVILLGSFRDKQAAIDARQAAEKTYHGEFTRGPHV